MGTKKCDYCGKEYDESFFGTLDNGSDACFNCIEDEEKRMKKTEERIKENKEKWKWKNILVFFCLFAH